MFYRRSLSAVFLSVALVPLAAAAEDFVIGDSTTTITNPPGFGAGDSITFQGNVQVTAGDAVTINPVAPGISLTFDAGSTTSTTAAGQDGVQIVGPFSGTFTNNGTISSLLDDGVTFTANVTGTVTNTGSITAGDSAMNFNGDFNGVFLNTGSLTGFDHGLDFDNDLVGTATNTGSIIGQTEDGVEIENDLDGTFHNLGFIQGGNGGTRSGFAILDDIDTTGRLVNSGTILGNRDGLFVGDNLIGTVTNSGTISGGIRAGVRIGDDIRPGGMLTNSGTITGRRFGIDVVDFLRGTIVNTGVIEGTNQVGIRTNRTSGTIRNHGGRIEGGNRAIVLGGNSGTVVLSGPSHIVGLIHGGGGAGDVIRFENMRGISEAKQAELAALAAADSTARTTVTLFGETITWQSFEDVQADLSTLDTYSSLITGPGLHNYAAVLDNVLGLNDSFRDLLRGLNDANPARLNEFASNASGQGQLNALDDFSREQNTRVYTLLSDRFSTMRGNVSGQGGSNAGVTRTGLLTREVQVGATVYEADDSIDTFVLGYSGRGTQNQNILRSESSHSNHSVLFGGGKRFSDRLYAGVIGGYTNNESATDRFGSLLQNEVAYFGIMAQYETDYWFANFIAAYGYHDMESDRRDFLGNNHVGDSEGHQGLLFTQIGRDYFFGREGQTQVTPYFGFALSSLGMDGYTESGPAGTALRIQDQDLTSFQSVVGVNVSTERETSYGWIRPKFDAAWWHSFDGSNGFGVAMATPGLLNPFDIYTPSANGDRGVFQLGVDLGFDRWESWTFNASYFGTVGGDGYSAHGGSLGATFEF